MRSDPLGCGEEGIRKGRVQDPRRRDHQDRPAALSRKPSARAKKRLAFSSSHVLVELAGLKGPRVCLFDDRAD